MNTGKTTPPAILLACFLFVITSPARAELRLGMKGGASLATQQASGQVLEGVDRPLRKGLAVGAVCEYALSSEYSLRIEPMYVQKGSEIVFHRELPGADNTLKLDYVVLPVNLKVNLDVALVRPFAFIGPEVGYALSGKHIMKTDGSTVDYREKKFDFGLDLGGGADIRLNDATWLTIDARLSFGVSDTDTDSTTKFTNLAGLVFVGVSMVI